RASCALALHDALPNWYAFLTHTAHHMSPNAKRGRALSARPHAVTPSGESADEPSAHPSWLTCSGRTAHGAAGAARTTRRSPGDRSEEHTSELQSRQQL